MAFLVENIRTYLNSKFSQKLIDTTTKYVINTFKSTQLKPLLVLNKIKLQIKSQGNQNIQ